MDVTVDDAMDVLNAQLKPLDAHAGDLESELAVIKETRKRLRAAITALQGGKAALGDGTPKKRCAKKLEVVAMMEAFLKDNGALPATDLKDLVSSKISEQKWSLSGFGLRFKEALASSRFSTSPENVVSLKVKSGDALVA